MAELLHEPRTNRHVGGETKTRYEVRERRLCQCDDILHNTNSISEVNVTLGVRRAPAASVLRRLHSTTDLTLQPIAISVLFNRRLF
ncbi:hypothetical protein KGM_204757 [Danaus plexippus plexippus]|uniref:Uncharacterized protein n=1 Tax=Danaus plexippus plexippus TaxID=278856 RepID=A0A212FEG1_DANPL|nr:hypothetical protein KGM_204757 [Danaus plexippus plexippus]